MSKITAFVMSDNEGAWARVPRSAAEDLGLLGEFRNSRALDDYLYLDVGDGEATRTSDISDFEVFRSAASAAGVQVEIQRLEPGMQAYEALSPEKQRVWHSGDVPNDVRQLPMAPYLHAQYDLAHLGQYQIAEFGQDENGVAVVRLTSTDKEKKDIVVAEADFTVAAVRGPEFISRLTEESAPAPSMKI